jgi:hypothetical protein
MYIIDKPAAQELERVQPLRRPGATGLRAARSTGLQQPKIKPSGVWNLLRDPLPNVFGAPDRDPRREFQWPRKRPCLNSSPQRGFGDGHEGQHLRLAQEPGLGQGGCRAGGIDHRDRRSGKRSRLGHDLVSLRPAPTEDMTCSFAAASVRCCAGRQEREARKHTVGVPGARCVGSGRMKAGCAASRCAPPGLRVREDESLQFQPAPRGAAPSEPINARQVTTATMPPEQRTASEAQCSP